MIILEVVISEIDVSVFVEFRLFFVVRLVGNHLLVTEQKFLYNHDRGE